MAPIRAPKLKKRLKDRISLWREITLKLENSVHEVLKRGGGVSKFVNWSKIRNKGANTIRSLEQSRFHFLSSVKRRLITRTYGIGVPYARRRNQKSKQSASKSVLLINVKTGNGRQMFDFRWLNLRGERDVKIAGGKGRGGGRERTETRAYVSSVRLHRVCNQFERKRKRWKIMPAAINRKRSIPLVLLPRSSSILHVKQRSPVRCFR